MLRLIETALPISGGKFLSVKFADGTEAVAPAEKEYPAPVESGVEAWCVCETRESGGRQFDLLTFWGPKHVWELQNASPAELKAAANEASVQAQAPPKVEKPKPEPKPCTFDMRELSIMAQVALKEAVPYAAQRVALGGSKKLETPAKIVKTARVFLKGMIEMASAAKDGSL